VLQPGVSNVKVNKSLKNFPAMITSAVTQAMRQMYSMMQPDQMSQISQNLTFEINPTHTIVVQLNKLRKESPSKA
jgi:HSP90 family molecular chaperone